MHFTGHSEGVTGILLTLFSTTLAVPMVVWP